MTRLSIDILSGNGLILGASAAQGGLNVVRRLEAFQKLYPVTGEAFGDLGCGVGAYSTALAEFHPKKMVLVDIDAANIDAAKTALSHTTMEKEFIAAPLESLELPEASLDCIFMIEVLDHVHDVARCYAQAHRFLKPGGRFYVAVPNRLFPLETHPVKFFGALCMPYWFPFLPWLPGLHTVMATARVFSTATLKRLAKGAGFGAPRIGYIMPPLEHRGPHWLRALFAALEKSPLACFGVTTCAVMVKS